MLRTDGHAVETGHTPAVVNLLRLGLNAFGFADPSTTTTMGALALVDNDLKNGKSRDQSKEGTDRTNCVAIKSSTGEGGPSNSAQKQGRDCQDGWMYRYYIVSVEEIVDICLGKSGRNDIVAKYGKRLEKRGGNSTEQAVGIQEGDHRDTPKKKRKQYKCQKCVPAYRPGFMVFVPPFFLGFSGNPRDEILQNAQRTQDGTVDPAKKQGKQQYCDETKANNPRNCDRLKQGRNKLQGNSPLVKFFGKAFSEINEQQSQQYQKKDGKKVVC